MNVSLRPMLDADLPMLHDWLGRPHVLEWWGGGDPAPSLGEVIAQYQPRILATERVTPYIATQEGQAIGYAQSYVAMGCGDGWWEHETDPGVRGIDQFLAHDRHLGRGLGTQLVCALVRMLFENPAVTRIQTDPAPDNGRAIRCYEKAGFRRMGTIVTPDGPAIYMLRDRPLDG